MKPFAACLFVTCAMLSFPCGRAAAETVNTKVDFERFAKELPYLEIGCVLYNRPDRGNPMESGAEVEVHNRILRDVEDGKHPLDSLIELLAHPEAKVRTLAAVALFSREDPHALPRLVPLVADDSVTFERRSLSAFGPRQRRMQTVSEVAGQMIRFYMDRSGFHYGVRHPTQPGFQEYWAARRNRTYWNGWFEVKLARASRGQTPLPKEAPPQIAALRKKIDALPMDDRAWELLALHNHEPGGRELVADAELVELCKKLGREKLLALLRNEIPCDDPDLKPRAANNQTYNGMKVFVLRRAADLLDAADADVLLAYEQRERNPTGRTSDPLISSLWPIAAARLAPNRAAQILHDAMTRFQGKFDQSQRADLCAALWQIVGSDQSAFIVDWFYEEAPTRGAPFMGRGRLLQQVGKDPGGKQLVARIIRDERFAGLGWGSVHELIQVVNGWNPRPVVSDEEERDVRHPLGIGHFDASPDEAKQKWPNETLELRRKLDEWRARLRASVPNWLDAPQNAR